MMNLSPEQKEKLNEHRGGCSHILRRDWNDNGATPMEATA